MTLEIIWYLVILLSIICYAMLDGFDLGVGMLHLFTKKDTDRRVFLNSIGPVWDGNEVWLVIVVGALFAGFPQVFATLFTTFYIPTMLLLMGLMFRAVSIEFRSKRTSPLWRKNWDLLFFIGSFVIAFGIGIVFGNLIQGLPLNQEKIFVGTLMDFLSPYALLVGCTTVALFAMHGAIFLVMKTENELHDKLRKWVPYCIALFIGFYLITTIATLYDKPYMIAPMQKNPILYFIPCIAFVCIIAIPFLMRHKKDGWAFIFSCLSIALLIALSAIGTYPYMIRSTIATSQNSLLIFNSASSPLTLKILLIIVGIGVPLVLAYGFYVYRIFRGKVVIDTHSY